MLMQTMYSLDIQHKCNEEGLMLKEPSVASPIFDAIKLLMLHGEVKSYGFIVSCVPESMFNYLQKFDSDFLCFNML